MRYRFALIRSFTLSAASGHPAAAGGRTKQESLPNHADVAHLLSDVDWELLAGPVAPYGDWAVENREEFALVGAARLAIVKQACESGKYNAIVLLGGGEPGAPAAREIARRYGIPVTSSAFSQMHVASMVGRRFSFVDLAESHSMHIYDLVLQHGFADRCASIRSINFPHSRPRYDAAGRDLHEEKRKALRGEPSAAVEEAVAAAVEAIEEDGADTILFSCSGTFWLRPFVQKRLAEIGWEVPVLDGLSTSITLAKALIDLGVDASGLVFPGDHPRRWRRKRTF
ncbi:aspartate/glutamate racemase family protein [Phytohabitans sp. ZYX-F-186]|uniref:Aspartate/glutamate racemase family protein n=1 Tax=Phytohabitans maris TaxID=3071409 RepID=A0ABU0ZC21_9ACTN|nr:aspartate/glutamate racemase family protein [Phytohabitans sp. ZYX-F-186]MDQ7904616.1 aspartate/glutamate racemase family protein [Phytohabitans sp. ZYX-F-186]